MPMTWRAMSGGERSGCCSTHHIMPYNSRKEGSKCASMSWQATGLVDIAPTLASALAASCTDVRTPSM